MIASISKGFFKILIVDIAIPNPCTDTALLNQELYHPHPYDDTKFIRCDYQQKMYVIQCPDGQRYTTVCALLLLLIPV